MFTLRRFALVLSLALLAAAPLAAQDWTALGPFGGSVRTLTVDPADARVVYATTDEGVFRSADGGATWSKVFRGYANANVAVAPGALYVTTYPGLIKKTTDGGAHWIPAANGLPTADTIVTAIAVDPVHPSRLYAGIPSRGVWRSADGGASWQPARRPIPQHPAYSVLALAAARRPAGTVYAGTNNGVYKSTDAGLTWRPASRGLPPGQILSLAVAPWEPGTVYAGTLSDGVFRSTDGGATWTAAEPLGSPILALAVSPRSARTVYAGTAWTGFFRSTDGGRHWVSLATAPDSRVNAVAAAPSSPRDVYLTVEGERGILASHDGGASWLRGGRGLAALPAVAFALDLATPGALWAGTQHLGLFRAGRAGGSWRRVLPEEATIKDVAASPSAPSTVYVLADHLWRSDDGGGLWTRVATPPLGAPWQFLWVDPLDSGRLWSAGYGRLFRSVDGGSHWSDVPAVAAGCFVAELAFAPSAPATVYVSGTAEGETGCQTARPGFYRSLDGGETWTVLSAALSTAGFWALAVDPVDSRLVFGGYDGVWRSEDGGGSWTRVLTGTPGGHIVALAASPLGVVWAGDSTGRLFRSADGGATWENRTPGFPPLEVRDLRFDPFDPRRLYAVTSGGVYATLDEP